VRDQYSAVQQRAVVRTRPNQRLGFKESSRNHHQTKGDRKTVQIQIIVIHLNRSVAMYPTSGRSALRLSNSAMTSMAG
jgi:hypothetical protein